MVKEHWGLDGKRNRPYGWDIPWLVTGFIYAYRPMACGNLVDDMTVVVLYQIQLLSSEGRRM